MFIHGSIHEFKDFLSQFADDVFQVLHHVTLDPDHVHPVLPRPTPQLPPAFFSSPEKTLDSLDFFTDAAPAGETLDALDYLLSSDVRHSASSQHSGPTPTGLDVLDSLDSLDDFSDGPQRAAAESHASWDAGANSLDDLDPLESVVDQADLRRNSQKPVMDELDSLDVLDTFPPVEGGLHVPVQLCWCKQSQRWFELCVFVVAPQVPWCLTPLWLL